MKARPFLTAEVVGSGYLGGVMRKLAIVLMLLVAGCDGSTPMPDGGPSPMADAEVDVCPVGWEPCPEDGPIPRCTGGRELIGGGWTDMDVECPETDGSRPVCTPASGEPLRTVTGDIVPLSRYSQPTCDGMEPGDRAGNCGAQLVPRCLTVVPEGGS